MLIDVIKNKNNLISVSGYETTFPPEFTTSFSGKENFEWEKTNQSARNDWLKFYYKDKINVNKVSFTIDSSSDFDFFILEKSYDGFDKFLTIDKTFNYDNVQNILTIPVDFTTMDIKSSDSVLLSTATDKARAYKIKSLKYVGEDKTKIEGIELYEFPILDANTNITVYVIDELFWSNLFVDNKVFFYNTLDFTKPIEIEVNSEEKTPYFRIRFFNCLKIKINNISLLSNEEFKENTLTKNFFFSRQRNKMPEIFENTDLMSVYNTYIENIFDYKSLEIVENNFVDSITPKENKVDFNKKFITLQVLSDTSWKLEKDVNWITNIVPNYGFGNQLIKVYLADNLNNLGIERQGKITCKDKNNNLVESIIIQKEDSKNADR